VQARPLRSAVGALEQRVLDVALYGAATRNGVVSDLEDLERIQPVYEVLPGWDDDLTAVRTFDELPPTAKRYVRRVEEACGVPVVCVSVGADRGETILLQNPFRA